MAKVLADFHHTGLYHSLHLLFEERLGMELYRPVGGDWFLEGFWRIAEPYNNHWVTVNQYLSVHQSEIPNEPRYRLNKVEKVQNGVYYIGSHRAIELQTFKEMEFDYIIASIPKHYREFTRLRDLYQPKAKVICQVGNQFDFPFEWVSNILSSTKYENIPLEKNTVFYHQEFPLDIFSFQPISNTRKISSFLHLFSQRIDYPLWLELQLKMPEWTFKEYGSQGKESYLQTDMELARAMHDSDIVMHFKEEGDGFGHIVHNVFATGRVLVTKEAYYKGRMAYDLMIDGETCLFWRTDKQTEWNISRIEDADLELIGQQAHNRFINVVDYDKEERAVREFLERAV